MPTDDPAEAAWDAELERSLREIHSGRAIGEPSADVYLTTFVKEPCESSAPNGVNQF